MTGKSGSAPGPWQAADFLTRHKAFQRASSDGLGEGVDALAERTCVADVMSRGIVCISADAAVDRVTELLLERDIGSTPVVDASWRPVGIISKTDLLAVLSAAALQTGPKASSFAPPKTVGDIAQPMVLSLHEAAPICVAGAIMAYEGVHRLPVVNADGQVTGIVSSLDIVRWVARCTNDEHVGEDG